MLGGLYLREEIVKDDKKASEPVFSQPLIMETLPVKEAVVVNDAPDKKTTQIKAIRALMKAEKLEGGGLSSTSRFKQPEWMRKQPIWRTFSQTPSKCYTTNGQTSQTKSKPYEHTINSSSTSCPKTGQG